MPLETENSPFYEVLDGLAFTMLGPDGRVVVIVANETLVRMNLPESADRQKEFLARHQAMWQRIASEKIDEGLLESNGHRVRIMPRDLTRQHMPMTATN